MVSQGISRTFEAVLVRQCAPTLAGLKPGNMFCHASLEVSRRKVRQWNEQLAPFGLTVRILLERSSPGSVIVYVYRRKHLEQLLSDNACRNFWKGLDMRGQIWTDCWNSWPAACEPSRNFPMRSACSWATRSGM